MKSPLAYVGGKSVLARTIVPLISPHETYIEPFCGAGWVFFSKEPSHYEILNDLDGDLICFYRVVQHHPEEFLKQFKWLLNSRQIFEEWTRQQEAGGLTDIQKVARYYYLQRLAFSGRVRSRTFGTATQRTPRINLLRLEEEMSAVYLRLAGTVIENLAYQECIAKYDRPETFFYLDPPYWACPYYKHNFAKQDFEMLATRLTGLQGKFILSLNDVSEVRSTFQTFRITPVTVRYTVNPQNHVQQGRELLISNFPLPLRT